MPPRSWISLITVTGIFALCACTTVPAGPYRARTALPENLAARYEKSKTPPSFFLSRKKDLEGCLLFRGEMKSENGTAVPFEYYRPKTDGQFPFVLVLPYLEGSYFFPRLICRNLARHGFTAAYLERPGDVLALNQKASELEQLTRAAIVRYRDFLDWVSQKPEVEREKIGFVGISMGSFVGMVLIAADDRISKAVLALPGCDVADLLLQSHEKKITTFMKSRLKDGKSSPQEIVEEFRRDFHSDPENFAPFLDSSGLLVVSARYDTTIPRVFSDRIWELLGKPTRIWLPTGHGSAGFCLPYIENKILKHFEAWK